MILDKLYGAVAKASGSARQQATTIASRFARSGGYLYSQQATMKQNEFFDNLQRMDTDTVLRKVGIARHQLKILLDDDEIDEKVERRIENLLQTGYTLSPSESSDALFVYSILNTHLETLLLQSMDAKLYGYSVSEIIWDKERQRMKGEIVPLEIIRKPMQWFEPKNDGRLLFFPDNSFAPVTVDSRYKFILMAHRPTFEEPKGKAILSRVYFPWFFKKNGWQFWSKFLERFGAPLLVGKTPNDTDKMAQALAAAHNQSILTMPSTDFVDVIASSGGGSAFKEYDDSLKRRIARYLLGSTLTSGVDSGGTAGQGEIHERQQQIVFDSDLNFALKYVRQFISLICELNGIEEAPWFNFKPTKGIQDALASRDEKLVRQGVEFTQEYYEDAYDLQRKHIKRVGQPSTTLPSNAAAKAAVCAHGNPLANDGSFDDEQMNLENLADDAIAQGLQPIATSKILAAIKASSDKDDLANRLFELCGNDLESSEFMELLSATLQAADIYGLADEAAE